MITTTSTSAPYRAAGMVIGPGNTAVLENGIGELAKRFAMDYKICYRQHVKRVAILVRGWMCRPLQPPYIRQCIRPSQTIWCAA